jgi:hypothetical protein
MNEDLKGTRGDDFDDVDAFGLDELGSPAGLSPMWGAVAGSGLGTVASMAARRFGTGKIAQHAEAVGFLAGAAASGTMIAMRRTRAAGWTGLAATFLNNGLRALEQYMMAPSLSGWGGVVVEPTTSFAGRGGLGLVDIQRTTSFQGSMGDQLPQLVGASLQDASDHVQLVGGPALNSFAHHWGATHFSNH